MIVSSPSKGHCFEVDISVAEEQESYALTDPEIQRWMLNEYPEDKLRAGMKKEMDLMKSFDVADEISVSEVTPEQLHGALDTTWVNRWKGLEVRSRLCVRGCFQQVEDLDKLFASTPVLAILKLLIVMSLAMGLSIYCFDITTAFLHAFLNTNEPPIFVWPPPEFFPGRNILWKLK